MLKTVFAVFLILSCTGKTNLMEKGSVVVLPVPFTDGESYMSRNTFRVPIPKLMLKWFSFQGHDSWVWLVKEMTQEFCKNIFYENSKFSEDFKARATDFFLPTPSPTTSPHPATPRKPLNKSPGIFKGYSKNNY